MMKKQRVVVAMSGGVDSSVAAALLKEQGYEVIGITLCFSAYGGSPAEGWSAFGRASGGNLADSTKKKPVCCSIQGIDDARRVAHKLGIRHYVLNMQKELEEFVIKNFCQEYLLGRTPNPCVRCNQYIKFGSLLKKALSLGAGYLATGHYARKAQYAIHDTQYYLLKKAKDRLKDQSYFLYRLSQNQLKYAFFPLGNYTKSQVRKLAQKFGLAVANKLASQEICFLPGVDYRRFLVHRLAQISKIRMSTDIRPGPVIDKHGNILGQHQGIAFYTIGQRQGLGIAKGYPLYITKIDPGNNIIVVGRKEEAYNKEFWIKEPHFILRSLNPALSAKDSFFNFFRKGGLKKKIAVKVRIRYNHKEAAAEIMPVKNKIKVCFKKPQFAITPGQSAVFYGKDMVLGGGIINEVLA